MGGESEKPKSFGGGAGVEMVKYLMSWSLGISQLCFKYFYSVRAVLVFCIAGPISAIVSGWLHMKCHVSPVFQILLLLDTHFSGLSWF